MRILLIPVSIMLFFTSTRALGSWDVITFTKDGAIYDGSYYYINVSSSAHVDMYGGYSDNVGITEQGKFYLYEGTIGSTEYGRVNIQDYGQYYQYGGNVHSIYSIEKGEVFIYGGGVEGVELKNDSKVYVYNKVDTIVALVGGEVHIYGWFFVYTETNVFDLYGRGFSNLRVYRNYSDYNNYYDIKLLDYWKPPSYPDVIRTIDHVYFHTIPEPTTLSLFFLGAFLAGRKRRMV